MSIEEFINKCAETNQYFGLGNPESKILFVGKEAGIEIGEELKHGTGISWKKNGNIYSRRFPPDKKLRDGKHTWQKYQKLFELISKKANIHTIDKTDRYEISFVEYLFTTELSNLNAKSSRDAKKHINFGVELKKRKELFWKSEFIDKFDIVVIFASDNQYIETFDGEVQELFKVRYIGKDNFGKSQNIWIHYSDDERNRDIPKLVIHTRQLTNGCSNKVIEKIAELVSEHIIKYEIEIKSAANT